MDITIERSIRVKRKIHRFTNNCQSNKIFLSYSLSFFWCRLRKRFSRPCFARSALNCIFFQKGKKLEKVTGCNFLPLFQLCTMRQVEIYVFLALFCQLLALVSCYRDHKESKFQSAETNKTTRNRKGKRN